MSDTKDFTENQAKTSAEDIWAETIAQQSKPPKPTDNGPEIFDNLEMQDIENQFSDINMIMDIPVKLTVELGRTKMTIKSY